MNTLDNIDMALTTLDEMVGNTYLYGRSQHTIKRFRVDQSKERVFILTDKNEFDRPFESIMDFINLFEPVPQSPARQPSPSIMYPERQVDGTVISKLKDVLMENIEKVKADKSYIPQAEAIQQNVNGIIDLAKTEIAYIDALTRLNKA